MQEYKGKEEQVLAGLMGENKNESDSEADVNFAGVSGKPDDGYAVLLETLLDFPYDRYGLRSTTP